MLPRMQGWDFCSVCAGQELDSDPCVSPPAQGIPWFHNSRAKMEQELRGAAHSRRQLYVPEAAGKHSLCFCTFLSSCFSFLLLVDGL